MLVRTPIEGGTAFRLSVQIARQDGCSGAPNRLGHWRHGMMRASQASQILGLSPKSSQYMVLSHFHTNLCNPHSIVATRKFGSESLQTPKDSELDQLPTEWNRGDGVSRHDFRLRLASENKSCSTNWTLNIQEHVYIYIYIKINVYI